MDARDLKRVGNRSRALDVDADFALAGDSNKRDIIAVTDVEIYSEPGVNQRLSEWTVTNDDIARRHSCFDRQNSP